MRLCVRQISIPSHETHPLKVRSSFLQLNKGFKQRQRQQHCSGCGVIFGTHQVLIEAILSSKCTGPCSSQETGSRAQERYAMVSSQVIRDAEFFPNIPDIFYKHPSWKMRQGLKILPLKVSQHHGCLDLRPNKFPTDRDHQQTSGRPAFHARKDVSHQLYMTKHSGDERQPPDQTLTYSKLTCLST